MGYVTSLSGQDYAHAVGLDAKITETYQRHERDWLKIGLWACEFREKQYYLVLGFPTVIAWAEHRFGKRRSTLFEAMRLAMMLTEEAKLAPADVAEMTQANANLLSRLPDRVRRDPKIIEAAKRDNHNQLREAVKKAMPNLPDEEEWLRWSIKLPKTLFDLWESTLEMAMRETETITKQAALDFIISEFRNDRKRARMDALTSPGTWTF